MFVEIFNQNLDQSGIELTLHIQILIMMEISVVKWASGKHYLNYYIHLGLMACATFVAISGTIVL